MKLFLAVLLIFLAAGSANSQKKQIEWLADFNQASRIARDEARPLLLDFTADWCRACREMDADFWTRADVVEASKTFVAVKIDFDKNERLANKYGVSFLPNIVLTDAWGSALVFHRGFGRRSDREIIEKLASIPTDFNRVKEAGDAVAAGKNDCAALLKLADFYQREKFYYLSSDFYKRFLKQEKNSSEREATTLLLGFNYLKIGWADDALALFARFKKDFPASARADETLYGEFSALTQKNLLGDAEKVLNKLKSKFPKSAFITQAELNLQAYRLQAK